LKVKENPGGGRRSQHPSHFETRLSMIGYDVVTAADGEEALDTFRKADPDLVVLDVMMPKLDGYGVCQLRKESDVPIIMLTALGMWRTESLGWSWC